MLRMTADTELIAGLMPNLSSDQIFRGKVWPAPPMMKNVMMNSSNEIVQANRAAAMMPGPSRGSVILRKTR
jgi:hypothetical protein